MSPIIIDADHFAARPTSVWEVAFAITCGLAFFTVIGACALVALSI